MLHKEILTAVTHGQLDNSREEEIVDAFVNGQTPIRIIQTSAIRREPNRVIWFQGQRQFKMRWLAGLRDSRLVARPKQEVSVRPNCVFTLTA